MRDFRFQRRNFIKGAASLGAFAGMHSLLSSQTILGLEQVASGEIPYSIGNWSNDAFDPLGNHRAVVRVTKPADAVRVHIPWRRRDAAPENKRILVISATSKAEVKNIVRVQINREYGDLVFQPESGIGDYYVYYLPYQGPGRSKFYPTIVYPPPAATATAEWMARNALVQSNTADGSWRKLPQAQVIEFQAVDAFNSFFPMEVIATASEVQELLSRHPRSEMLLFPEDRSHSIRMAADLPRRWIKQFDRKIFRGSADRGEYYVMQIGVYAANGRLENLEVHFPDLRAQSGAIIPRSALTCFNTGGVNWSGEPFINEVSVAQDNIQPLWLGVQVPDNAHPGEYRGVITVTAESGGLAAVDISLTVSNQSIKNYGDDDPYNLARLRWLNSRLAEDDSLVQPFIPLSLNGNVIDLLGRSVTVGRNGFPDQIRSYYAPGNTHIAGTGRDILASPISLVVESADGPVRWKSHNLDFNRHLPGKIDWSVKNTSGPLTMIVGAHFEFDGNIEFAVALSSTERMPVKDIRLEVPYFRDVAVYMMGLGQKGGYRPPSFRWQWDVQKNQDSVWVGDVNAGMQVGLRDDRYSRPLNTNFYHLKPLVMPVSWSNDGQGGCSLADQGTLATLLTCYSGSRTINPGETLYYNFRLLITPFKPVNTHAHWHNRYYHNGCPPPADVKETGANVINIHHGTSINPYLNYPFLRPQEMKAYIDQAHSLNMKVKIYYTVRELSDHAPEMFALRSLNHEIFVPGPGGGYSWLQEHLASDYIAGWCVPEMHDATIINSGGSRWHNYYVEGINWLAQNVGIDGIYLDDLAFDRLTMQRVRKVMDKNRPDALIDLHSANQYDERDGFASSANLYMGEFPYINRLWFGEYFDYNSKPDYYLIEISGIPFGLMGEMLQGGGNPWRGMVYGMTSRLGHSGDPRPLWKAWDAFGIEDSQMKGYWVPDTPVKTGERDVLATSFVKQGSTLVAIASWANDAKKIRLRIDCGALGIDPAKVVLTAPAIENFQEAAAYRMTDDISVSPGRGLLLIITAGSQQI
jgi:hypothetical protein